MKIDTFLNQLLQEDIHTWFDLGLFLDRFKETRKLPATIFKGTFSDFKNHLQQGGVGFISYHYSVDGVTIETEKYAKSLRQILPQVPIHYIAGEFYPEASKSIDPSYHKFELKEIQGFEKWKLYKEFYFIKLKRGSKEYNELIVKLWSKTLTIVTKLGRYISEHDINLLYLLNTNSNPGNVALSLALVLLSDGLGIPVINNNHDFLWEGGNSPVDRKTKHLSKGPRDFFYKNHDIGEFFSLIEVLFPWESRSWLNLNINQDQSNHVIECKGHNPANVAEINTAVDTLEYTSVTKRRNIESFKQIQRVFSKYTDKIKVYTPEKVLNSSLVHKDDSSPILVGGKSHNELDFVGDNIVFLQPTRIMPRKRIETDFNLIKRLFDQSDFANKFRTNPKLKLTLLISGPIPQGQYRYFLKLIGVFSGWLKTLKAEFSDRVFLGFLFSEFDKDRFRTRSRSDTGMPHLYNIASLILLPSETEGRGLPIIEASACGIPIFCRQYHPLNVYSEVIGKHLSENKRLKVLEFNGVSITDQMVQKIANRVFFPQNYLKETEHNQRVVRERFSLESLTSNLEKVLKQLYQQLKPQGRSLSLVAHVMKSYSKSLQCDTAAFRHIMKEQNRNYLPGYGKLGFMQYLKSLIDPSFFRIEEQRNKGHAMRFARKLVNEFPDVESLSESKITTFFNAVDNIFYHRVGEVNVQHDHSFAYRHRNKNFYPYHNMTAQERSGLINMLFYQIIGSADKKNFLKSPHFFTDWNLALFQMTNSTFLEIDDRPRLIKYLRKSVPIGYFPGEFIQQELEYFILQPVRSRLGLKIEEELTADHLKHKVKSIPKVHIFCPEKALGKWLTYRDLNDYLDNHADTELQLLFNSGIIQIVETYQWTVGIHFAQLGNQALEILGSIKDKKGFIIACGDNPAMMTDIVDIDRFHIGKADKEVAAHMMGVALNSGFIQFVPAGVRTTLAYPTPIQTSRDFHHALKTDLYQNLCKRLGEQVVLKTIKTDAEKNGSPIKKALKDIQEKVSNLNHSRIVTYTHLSGLHDDGLPWSGVLARTSIPDHSKDDLIWKFTINLSTKSTKKVVDFIDEFEADTAKSPEISWNGGYLLNAELVGKLGISENFIGSPLGLIISDKKVIAPPLFNKPALIIKPSGQLHISRVNSSKGITISDQSVAMEFTPQNYNLITPLNEPCYYDLMFESKTISGANRVIVRLAGNIIKEVIYPQNSEEVKILPVGLTLSIPKDQFPKQWSKVNKALTIQMHGWPEIQDAIEAGPLLVDRGENCIDMGLEGWKTENSIKTQAARIDYCDMRGPKIAVGIDKKGNLVILTINGRIRESVGATHADMADILIRNGVQKAMGFDPGGSSTLIIGHQQVNISPYNPNFESDTHALPPIGREVSSTVMGWVE